MASPKVSPPPFVDDDLGADRSPEVDERESIPATEFAGKQKLVKSKANKKKSVKAKRSPAPAKAKAPVKAKPAKKSKPKAKKATVKKPKAAKKTGLNPNGRKFLGPNGSPRGIRQDGKPRVKPGKNKPKSEETRKYGARVSAARQKKEFTQSQLAAKMGISQPGLANIERGVTGCSDEMKAKFKKHLGVGA